MKNNYHHSQRKKINKYGAFFCCCLCSKNQALELTWGHGSSVFLSWSPSRTSSSQDSHQVELCRQLGERLGLKDGEQVHLHSEAFVWLPACLSVTPLGWGGGVFIYPQFVSCPSGLSEIVSPGLVSSSGLCGASDVWWLGNPGGWSPVATILCCG